MKAKKLLSLLLALAMVFALAACSSNNEPKASERAGSDAKGSLCLRQHP